MIKVLDDDIFNRIQRYKTNEIWSRIKLGCHQELILHVRRMMVLRFPPPRISLAVTNEIQSTQEIIHAVL